MRLPLQTPAERADRSIFFGEAEVKFDIPTPEVNVTFGIAGVLGAAFKSVRETTKLAAVSVAPEVFLAVIVTGIVAEPFAATVGIPLTRGAVVVNITASRSTKELVLAFHVYFHGLARSAVLFGMVITVDPPRVAESIHAALILPDPSNRIFI
jgi:hypothetical protein